MHGIRGGDLLVHGQSPAQVASALNAALGPNSMAWCDGGPYNAHWARALFKAAGVKPAFALRDWSQLISLLGKVARERALAWIEQSPARYRARADAGQLLLALAHAAGVEAGPIQDLDLPTVPSLAG